jgi:probable HAF family extracellular repeat protein
MMVPALAICASSGVFVHSNDQSSETYTVTDLGTLGGAYSLASDINASGQVVGSAWTMGNTAWHAFVWQNGAMTDLGTLGGATSTASSISDSGQILGSSAKRDSGFACFLWQNGAMSDFATLGGTSSCPHDINASGQVVGSAATGDGVLHAFLWQDGILNDLGTLGGTRSSATAINDRGEVVGNATTIDGVDHAFLWQNGAMSDLRTLGGIWSYASAINDSGHVVGSAATADGVQRAFLWQNGVINDLGTLGGDSFASDINASGQVVGTAFINEEGECWTCRAFLWQNGVMTDLNMVLPSGSGWVLEFATAINDGGQIVGWGYLNGETRAFLLTPLVTPSPDPPAPFGAAPIAVPGRIEAENYDHGGAGAAYADLTGGNSGGEYRSEDVDIERVAGSTNDYNVGWMFAGEWLQYTIAVGAAGSYALEAGVASNNGGGTFHLEVNGTAATGPISIPDTGGWQQWQTVTTTVTLAAGLQRLRVVLDTNGSSGTVGNLNYLKLTPEIDTAIDVHGGQ